ncbi:MAG: hypothetical protein ACOYJ1_01095 [Peptococcales bacterium]
MKDVNTYICKKACILNGKQVNAGMIIPRELIVENRIPALLRMGYIQEGPTIVSTTAPAQPEPAALKSPSDNPEAPEDAASVAKPAQTEPEQPSGRGTPTPDEKPLKTAAKAPKQSAAKTQPQK